MSNAAAKSNTKRKGQLKNAIQSARSVKEALKTFTEMETCFDESELGLECFTVAVAYFSEPQKDFQKVFSFANRALTILTSHNDPQSCLHTSLVLHFLGSVHLELRMCDKGLSFLNRAEANLSKLDNQILDTVAVLKTALDIQTDLYTLTEYMGRKQDVIVHATKILKIKEKIMNAGCVEIGKANQAVYEAYFGVMDLERALPFCLKALEIYKKHFGADSVEVAKVMRHLALVYSKMGEHQKAFEHNQLAQSVFGKKAPGSPDLLRTKTECGNMLIDLGRYEEAVDVLKSVVKHAEIVEGERTKLLVTTARAFWYLEKFDDAKTYLRKAQRILDKKEMHPMLVAIGFVDMSVMYEKMGDSDAAVSLLKRVIAVPELPQELLLEHSLRLLLLMSQSGNVKEEISYMEGVVEKLKKSVGPKHSQVGHAYASLGVAHSNSGQEELAVKCLENAKDALDVSLGPHHLSSLKYSHGLSVAYAGLGRFAQALEIEKKVAQGLKGLEPSELGFVHAVSKHLSKMKEMVTESPISASSQSKDEGGLSAKLSKCDISDDGKGT